MAMSCSWTIGHAERGSWEGDDGLMESTCTACETDAATMDVDGCRWMWMDVLRNRPRARVCVCDSVWSGSDRGLHVWLPLAYIAFKRTVHECYWSVRTGAS